MANKRLLSLLVASAMSLTYVTANAAAWEYEMDGSDVIITTPFDEKTAVAAKGADVSVNVEKKEAVDADIEALGRTWKNYISKATADVYKVVFTVSNLGTLVNGYDNTDQAYFGIYDMTINYGLDSAVMGLVSKKATLPDNKTITPLMGKTATDINLVLPVSSNNTVDTVWPTPNTVVESGNIVAESYIAVKPGSKITLKQGKGSNINYAVQSQDIGVTAGIWTNTNIDVEDIVLGASSTVAVTGVTIKDKADFTLDLNGDTTKTLEAIVAPEDATNKAVTWTSSKEDVATVVDGKVTAVAKGETVITVTTDDGKFTDSVNVTVEDSTPVAPIISVESVSDMLVGDEITLNVSNDQDAALDYKFASLNEKVATVDEKGVVKAVGIGNAKITISAAGAESAELTVTVRAAGENDEVVLPGTDKKIKVFKMQNVNFGNHNYFIYITKNGDEKKSAQTIGEILGGEWVEGSDVKGTIAIGLITDSALDAFSFEVK